MTGELDQALPASFDQVDVPRRRPSLLARFARHRAGLVGAVVVLAFAVGGFFATAIAPHDPLTADPLIRLQASTPEHWLGTDQIGRDMFSRLLHGASISMRACLVVVFLGIFIGVPLGAVSGYAGGVFDLLVQRAVDTIQAFPGILLLIMIVALIGPSLELAVMAIGFHSVPVYTRLVRGNVLLVKQLPYVESARAVGSGAVRILARHVVPNSITPVIIQATLQSANALLLLAGLSFLGLGAQPPTPEWGSMLATGRMHMRSSPHLVIFPGLAVSLVVLGLNLVGDALRDALDPRATQDARR